MADGLGPVVTVLAAPRIKLGVHLLRQQRLVEQALFLSEPGITLVRRQFRQQCRVVSDVVPHARHGDAATNPFLAELVHVPVAQLLELHTRLLEHGVPGKSRKSHIADWIEAIVPEANVPELLKHVRQPEHVHRQVQVVELAEGL